MIGRVNAFVDHLSEAASYFHVCPLLLLVDDLTQAAADPRYRQPHPFMLVVRPLQLKIEMRYASIIA
jgi:hypothetical protein